MCVDGKATTQWKAASIFTGYNRAQLIGNVFEV